MFLTFKPDYLSDVKIYSTGNFALFWQIVRQKIETKQILINTALPSHTLASVFLFFGAQFIELRTRDVYRLIIFSLMFAWEKNNFFAILTGLG